jgi:hypothetical protein
MVPPLAGIVCGGVWCLRLSADREKKGKRNE